MPDAPFRFHLRLGNFSFEIEGERSFVERTLTRYEGRFLPRFQQLIDKIPAVDMSVKAVAPMAPVVEEHRPPAPVHAPPQKAEVAPQKEKEPERERDREWDQRKDRGRFQKSDQRRRDDRRRGGGQNRVTHNNRVMPAPVLPRDQEVIKHPYMPPDGFDLSAISSSEDAIPEPAPVYDRVEPAVEPVISKKEPEMVRELAVVTDEDIEEDEGPAVLLEGDQSDDALKKFYETMKPRTHHEKIMVFAYFLQVKRGMKEFGTGKVKSCYDSIGVDAAGNINQVLNHACRTGFCSKTQRGRSVKYSLTSKGKQFVERDLESS